MSTQTRVQVAGQKVLFRIFILLSVGAVLALPVILMTKRASANVASGSSTIVISQVFGGGGSPANTGAYRWDYIELRNVSLSPQPLSGLKLVYGSATGNFAGSLVFTQFTLPNITLAPGQYFLVRAGETQGVGPELPVEPDAVSGMLLSQSSGKIALVNNSFLSNSCGSTANPCPLPNASILDLVSYGAANNAEGGSPTNGGTALTALQGNVRMSGGYQDTDNNNNDFTIESPPIPHNSGGISPPGIAYGDTAIVDRFPNLPLENRTPVIMIHGIHGNRVGNDDTIAVTNKINFKNLYNKLNATPEYNAGFKTYVFQYVSDRYTTEQIGQALRDHIDRFPGFSDKPIVLVAHSMGGLVARWYLLQTTYSGTTFYGLAAGNRVTKLITLATPHHGTYGANLERRLDGVGSITKFALRKALSYGDRQFWESSGCALCATTIRPNRSSLLWDNFDSRFSYPSGSSEIPTETPNTSQFNSKIIAYYGDIAATDQFLQSVRNVDDLIFAIKSGDNHAKLVAASVLINSVESHEFDFSAPRNDGLVPRNSGGFDGGNIDRSIRCPGSDHEQMRDGTFPARCSDEKFLLSSVRDNILGINVTNPRFLSGPDNTGFGNRSITTLARPAGDRPEISQSVRPILLSNSGDQALSVTSMVIGGNDSNQFSIVSGPIAPFTIPAQGSVTVNVSFSPTSTGDKTAELQVDNDSANSPIVVPLSGTGFPPACDLTLSPSSGFVAAGGGTSVIDVGNIPCQMSVSASESWLHPVVVGDHVEFITDPNTGTTQRDGVVFISLDGGPTLPFGVSQSPASQPCGLNFSAEQAMIPTTGGGSGFEVTTPTNCSWTYQSDSAWLTLVASGVLTGPQQVTFNAPAATSSRTANITVTDGTMTGEFTITQPGPANISGRVLNRDGRGVTNAKVTLESNVGQPIIFRTNRFGYYHFDNLPAGIIYTVRVNSRRYSFETRYVQLVDSLTDVDFIANP